MKKFLLGAALGVGAVYLVKKLHKEGKLDGLYESVNDFSGKAKRDVKNLIDAGKNEAEYLKGRLEYKANHKHKQ